MKYIVLSFDDGRKDFFTRALPILNKYHLRAVLNVVSDTVGSQATGIGSGNGEHVSWDELQICRDSGIEIANHSAKHNNEPEDIIAGAKAIREQLGITEGIGFASPHSEICGKNIGKYRKLLEEGHVTYIRSGNQIRRDGYVYAGLFFLYKYTRLAPLFYWYNRRNIMKTDGKPADFLPSVTCNANNTNGQLMHFVKKMPKDSAAILMFHSILEKNDAGYGKDKWFNTTEEFDAFCKFLRESKDVSVVTTRELLEVIN